MRWSATARCRPGRRQPPVVWTTPCRRNDSSRSGWRATAVWVFQGAIMATCSRVVRTGRGTSAGRLLGGAGDPRAGLVDQVGVTPLGRRLESGGLLHGTLDPVLAHRRLPVQNLRARSGYGNRSTSRHMHSASRVSCRYATARVDASFWPLRIGGSPQFLWALGQRSLRAIHQSTRRS